MVQETSKYFKYQENCVCERKKKEKKERDRLKKYKKADSLDQMPSDLFIMKLLRMTLKQRNSRQRIWN